MLTLLPRLPAPSAERSIREFLGGVPDKPFNFNPYQLPTSTRFAATGGRKADAQVLKRFRQQLVERAQACGFGSSTSRSGHSEFDFEVASWLAQEPMLTSGEALRDDVWSFIGAVVAPDIVHWRFGKARERYLGGIRNTFQRLWVRGSILDRGSDAENRWLLLQKLTEDAMVQITERPSLSADRRLSLFMAEAWLRAAEYHGKSEMESRMRSVVLQVRIRNEIQDLSGLPQGKLSNFLDDLFEVPNTDQTSELAASEIPDKENAKENLESDCTPAVKSGEGSVDKDERLAAAARRILEEAESRNWASVKLTSALLALKNGKTDLRSPQLNALKYLLNRMTEKRILIHEVDFVRRQIV